MKKFIWGVIAVLLAASLVITTVVGSSGFTNWNVKTWFDSWGKGDPIINIDRDDSAGTGGGAIVTEGEAQGVMVKSARIPRTAYKSIGISEKAETSYLLTAKASPDDSGTNTGVKWTLELADKDNTWFAGKKISDYVTLSAMTKQAIVTCLQPFGAQLEVKATSVANPEASATCKVDYVQKVTDISLSFGDVACDFAKGETGVTVELAETGTPKGGATNLTVTYEDTPYTKVAEYEVSYKLSPYTTKDTDGTLLYHPFLNRYTGGVNATLFVFGSFQGGVPLSNDIRSDYTNVPADFSAMENYAVGERGLQFGIKYFADNLDLNAYFGPTNSGSGSKTGVYGEYGGVEQMSTIYDGSASGSVNDGVFTTYYYVNPMFNLTVTLSGKHVSISRTTTFKMTGYTNEPIITGVDIEGGNGEGGNVEF